MSEITRQQAKSVLERIIANDSGKKLYLCTQPFNKSYDVKDVDGAIAPAVRSPFERFWLGLIDDKPRANWDHDCRYVFINAHNSQDYRVFSRSTPIIDPDLQAIN